MTLSMKKTDGEANSIVDGFLRAFLPFFDRLLYWYLIIVLPELIGFLVSLTAKFTCLH